jgi:hypothetical protein
MVMSKMSRFCTGKMVILLDSSGNNPVKAKRIKRKDGQYYFPFPLYDKEGNEITEHKRPYENAYMYALETQTDTKSIKSRRNVNL